MTDERIIGKGRSGIVYLLNPDTVRERLESSGLITVDPVWQEKGDFSGTVEKRFEAHGFLKGAQTLAFGAPVYDNDKDTVLAAYHRRFVLDDLCEYWFEGKLRVAKPRYVQYDQLSKSFALAAEFIKGRAPKILSPFNHDTSELTDLVETTQIFQAHLIEAGFVGTLWQAGYGNPVGLNNYLLDTQSPSQNGNKWVMIDCESGASPYVPIRWKAFRHYVKESLRLKRLLFDDVDIVQLKLYVSKQEGGLQEKLGSERHEILLSNIVKLEEHQSHWLSRTRIERGIAYKQAKGEISARQADWYLNHPLLWYGGQTTKLAMKGSLRLYDKLVGEMPCKLANEVLVTLGEPITFVLSEKHRAEIGRYHASKLITTWQEKGRLSAQQAYDLREQLGAHQLSEYMGDFAGHAWFAFLGIIPKAGNLAYPIQMTASAAMKNQQLPMFLVVGLTSKMGEKIPIIGGSDTLTEHYFNRIGYRVGRYFGKMG